MDRFVDTQEAEAIRQTLLSSDGIQGVHDLRLRKMGDLLVVEASADGYKQLLRQTVLKERTWAQPVLANGRIYVRDNQGNLACVGL
jgi:hypothetical protein